MKVIVDLLTLMLKVSDWKGGLQMRLQMPRRDQDDSVLEEGNDVLPEPLREEVLGYFLGFLEGYISVGPMQEFERRYAYSGIAVMRYGVKDGVPFDEAKSESCTQQGDR